MRYQRIADAQAQIVGVPSSFLVSPSPVRAKRSSAVRMRIAVSGRIVFGGGADRKRRN